MAAVRAAHADGATSVECDVHRTRDGVLVALHDAALGRTTQGDERISDITYDELRDRDAGTWFDPGVRRRAGADPLQEWIAAVGPDRGMFVEVKQPAAYPGIAADLDVVLRSAPASVDALVQGRLTVQSFDHVWLQRFKECAPDVPVAALVSQRPRRRTLVDIASWAEQVNPRARVVTQQVVDRAHDLGLLVHPWTVDELLPMHRLAAWGVDGIITNRPARLSSMLESRAS